MYMCELRRFKGHLHFIKDTTIGYNIHLKDRYSAVRLTSNCIKLRTSQTISSPILRAVEVSQGYKMYTE